MRRWIYIVKEMKKRAKKHKNREDIRGYFFKL